MGVSVHQQLGLGKDVDSKCIYAFRINDEDCPSLIFDTNASIVELFVGSRSPSRQPDFD